MSVQHAKRFTSTLELESSSSPWRRGGHGLTFERGIHDRASQLKAQFTLASEVALTASNASTFVSYCTKWLQQNVSAPGSHLLERANQVLPEGGLESTTFSVSDV